MSVKRRLTRLDVDIKAIGVWDTVGASEFFICTACRHPLIGYS